MERAIYRDGHRKRKKIMKLRYKATIVGGSGGRGPPEVEEDTIFFTLKIQFLGLFTYGLLGLSTNATPKLLPKL